MNTVYLILQNIRSAHNVGSILRTADCAGVGKVYLCGTTPSPVDRFGRKRSDVAKVALGTEESVSWEYCEDARTAIQDCKEKGMQVVAVEQDERSVPYMEYEMQQDAVFVLGEETVGLPQEVLEVCDAVVEIPQRGKKESLNVSVAAGVVLFGCIK